MYLTNQMEGLIENKGMTSITYVFEDEKLFSLTGYKVMKSQGNGALVRSAKVLYNGKIKLVYFTAGYKVLNQIFPSLGENAVLAIVSNLINAVINIKNNGFLLGQNISIDSEKIFIDPNTLEVGLIYLPVNGQPTDWVNFENLFRTWLVKVVMTCRGLDPMTAEQICAELSNGLLSLEELPQHIHVNGQKEVKPHDEYSGELKEDIPDKRPELTMSAVGVVTPTVFRINKSEYLIGKNAAMVDGVVNFNKAISRVHCKIVYEDKYYIIDLDSVNGTFVNDVRIKSQQKYPLSSGDRIRLADMGFTVEI